MVYVVVQTFVTKRSVKKIRDITMRKVPYILVLGEREMQDGTVTVRSGAGKRAENVSLCDFIAQMRLEIKNRGAKDRGC